MTYYITNGKTAAVNEMEFASIEAALDFARAPAWAGAKPTEIQILSENSYKVSGQIYRIENGNNPRILRKEAAKHAEQVKISNRSAFNAGGNFKGSAWLSREMDRSNSDL